MCLKLSVGYFTSYGTSHIFLNYLLAYPLAYFSQKKRGKEIRISEQDQCLSC